MNAIDLNSKQKSNVTQIKKIKSLNKSLDINNFPFPKHDKYGNITGAICHIDNLRHILLSYGISAKYNLITKEQEIVFSSDSFGISDNKKTQDLEIIKSLCDMNKFPVSRIQDQISALSNTNSYNPVFDYCTENKWDRIDRIQSGCDTVSTDEKIAYWKESAIMKFMVAAACASINDQSKKFKFKSILTFQGAQGLGKTPWMRILCGGLDDYFLQGHLLNPENKDSKITALKHWIVELGEVDATTKKADVAALKGFIDQYSDSNRLPYAAEISTWPRRTVFYATVNPSSFLIDNTGNDRFWCIPVLSLNLCDLEKIDMQQLWAQVYESTIELLNDGNFEPWALTDGEREMQRALNESFRLLTPLEETILEEFNGRENEATLWQASLLDICEALGWSKSKLSAKEKQSAKVMLDSMFKLSKYLGKRGYAIPDIQNTHTDQLVAIGMKKRGKKDK